MIDIDGLLVPGTRVHPTCVLPESRTGMHARHTRTLLNHCSEIVVARTERPVIFDVVQPFDCGGVAGIGYVDSVLGDVVLLVGQVFLEGDPVLYNEHRGLAQVAESRVLGAVALAATLDHVLLRQIIFDAAHLHEEGLVHRCYRESPACGAVTHILYCRHCVLISPIPIRGQITADLDFALVVL